MSKRQPDGLVARDKDRSLTVFDLLPFRSSDGCWLGRIIGTELTLSKDHPLGTGLTWRDEPRPVYLTRHNPDDVARLVEAAKRVSGIQTGECCFSCKEIIEQALEPFTKESM